MIGSDSAAITKLKPAGSTYFSASYYALSGLSVSNVKIVLLIRRKSSASDCSFLTSKHFHVATSYDPLTALI